MEQQCFYFLYAVALLLSFVCEDDDDIMTS